MDAKRPHLKGEQHTESARESRIWARSRSAPIATPAAEELLRHDQHSAQFPVEVRLPRRNTNDYLRGDFEWQIDGFVEHYSHRRYHQSQNILIRASVYT